MRKIFTLAIISLLTVGASAQVLVNGSKFLDNWSLGINGGIITPTYKSAFFNNMRPTVGLELTKMFTPTYGLAIEARGAFNTSDSRTAIDASVINLLGKINLYNLFCAYPGVPRPFEISLIAGAGYIHNYVNGASDPKNWNVKGGLDFAFNLGEAKAWQINVRPAMVALMDPNGETQWFKKQNMAFELTAGVTYKFKNSNDSHNFTLARPYDESQVDCLNAKVNDLRSQTTAKDQAIAGLQQQVAGLQQQVVELQNRQPVKETTTITKNNKTMESVVTFGQGKSSIDHSQLPNVERIATYMKNHPNSTVIIKGYASPEGSIAVNERIANARAQAVKNMLISKYRIKADRIQAEGQGVGDMFSEPDWNRVSICTLDETE